MTKGKWLFLLLIASTANNAQSAEWSRTEIRAVGKNLTSMAGFYMECGKRGLVQTNANAMRSAVFMGSKYLFVAGIENEAIAWSKNGANGLLISDPTKSEKTVQTEFTKDTCTAVKNFLDIQYQAMDDAISGRYKNK